MAFLNSRLEAIRLRHVIRNWYSHPMIMRCDTIPHSKSQLVRCSVIYCSWVKRCPLHVLQRVCMLFLPIWDFGILSCMIHPKTAWNVHALNVNPIYLHWAWGPLPCRVTDDDWTITMMMAGWMVMLMMMNGWKASERELYMRKERGRYIYRETKKERDRKAET